MIPQVTTTTEHASPLRLGADGGGPRWFLRGEPVHAGTGLEMGIVVDSEYDEDRGYDRPVRWLWLRVRLEFEYHRDAAVVYISTAGGARFLSGDVPEGVLFRWPLDRYGRRRA